MTYYPALHKLKKQFLLLFCIIQSQSSTMIITHTLARGWVVLFISSDKCYIWPFSSFWCYMVYIHTLMVTNDLKWTS